MQILRKYEQLQIWYDCYTTFISTKIIIFPQ